MPDPIISQEARADLSAAWDFLADRNQDAADQFLDDFWVVASRHPSFPRTGRPRDDLRPGLRSFAVGRYVAFFTQTPTPSELSACFTVLGTSIRSWLKTRAIDGHECSPPVTPSIRSLMSKSFRAGRLEGSSDRWLAV